MPIAPVAPNGPIAPDPPVAPNQPAAPVCARLEATLAAREVAPAPRGPRKLWLSWSVLEGSRDLAAAVAGKVQRVLGERDGQVLVVATAAQRSRLPSGVTVMQEADEMDWVGCGSLGYQVAPLGRVAPAVSLPAEWRDRGADRSGARIAYCMQLVGPPPDDADHTALAVALGASDAVPLSCTYAPSTCELALTRQEAAKVARLSFVRGLFRREPAFKLGSSLACPGRGDLPVAPAEMPAVLRAATARPHERVTVMVTLDGEPDELAAALEHLPAGATVVDGAPPMLTISLARRGLAQLAALRPITYITELGPGPGLLSPD